MEKSLEEKYREIIKKNIYLAVATASKEGKHWISPVFYAFDDGYNLYWVSNKDSLHSQLIRANPQVAIVIFDSSVPEGAGDGVYFEAIASELETEEEIKQGIEIMDQKETKDKFRLKEIANV